MPARLRGMRRAGGPSRRSARIHGPRQLTDLYLLALAVRHGGRLVTLEGSIARDPLRRAQPGHLVVL